MGQKRIPLPGESTAEEVLSALEVRGPDGSMRFRISRYCSADGSRWVRHGRFQMFHPNGTIATEGQYKDGLEEGNWRDYYENGQIAAEGCYANGKEEGYWRFWHRDGTEQPPVEYAKGEEVR
jgi:hypothetical protein